MNNVLLPVFYLPPVQWFAEFMDENNNVVFEEWENFPKQTYRNRTEIYGANGKLALIIPTKHTGSRLYKETEISYAENWQKLHWKSIKTAYQSSPYFEFYEHQLEDIYSVQTENLMEFNFRALNIILKILKTEKKFASTSAYEREPEATDFRDSFSAKKDTESASKEYYQVFSDKLGYIPNLSIVDLLCNLGPESATYLKNFK